MPQTRSKAQKSKEGVIRRKVKDIELPKRSITKKKFQKRATKISKVKLVNLKKNSSSKSSDNEVEEGRKRDFGTEVLENVIPHISFEKESQRNEYSNNSFSIQANIDQKEKSESSPERGRMQSTPNSSRNDEIEELDVSNITIPSSRSSDFFREKPFMSIQVSEEFMMLDSSEGKEDLRIYWNKDSKKKTNSSTLFVDPNIDDLYYLLHKKLNLTL